MKKEKKEDKILGKAISSCPLKLDMPTYCQGYVDGFHEGEKLDGWHYVKDGDLPKKVGRYYCAIKTTIITGGYKYDVEIKSRGRNVHSKKWFWADYSDPTWGEWALMKVYAWKEINAPEDI